MGSWDVLDSDVFEWGFRAVNIIAGLDEDLSEVLFYR